MATLVKGSPRWRKRHPVLIEILEYFKKYVLQVNTCLKQSLQQSLYNFSFILINKVIYLSLIDAIFLKETENH